MRRLYILLMRFRSLFLRNRVERELDEELRYHLEREIQQNIAGGLTAEDAHYQALRAMDGFEQRKEECRDMRRVNVVDNLVQDFRYGLRNLRKNPGFTAAALLTLALGVGVNIAVFAIVEAVLLRPLPYAAADRLVVLNHRDQRTGFTKDFIAIGDYLDLMAGQSTFEAAGGYGSSRGTVFGIGEPFRVSALTATTGALDALGMKPVLGRSILPEDSRPDAAPVAMLGYELWQSHFGGDSNIVGRGVKLGQRERQIVGVAPKGFHFPPNAPTEMILPIPIPVQAPGDRKADWTFVVARLKPGSSIAAASSNLSTLSRQMEQDYPASNQGSQYFPVGLRDSFVGNTKPALMLLLGAVVVVLLIACVNVANLMLARSLARGPEMTLRMALGAGRGRLMAQLLTESFTLSIAAGVVGILVAQWGARALVTLVPKSVSVAGLESVGINGSVLAFTLLVTILTAMGVGLVSALTVRANNAASALGASNRVGVSGAARRATSSLVIAEVALAIVLLIGAGLILRSFDRLLSVDPGFRTDRVLTIDIALPGARYNTVEARQAFYARALPALRAIHDVAEAGAAVVVPLTGNHWTTSFERADQPVPSGQRPPEVGWQTASAGYFRALQIPLLSGRLFNDSDTATTRPVVIVSKAIRDRFFTNEDPVGRELRLGDQKAEIVGVVADIRRAGLRELPHEDMYFPFEQREDAQTTLFIRTVSEPSQSIASAQSALKSIEPDIVFSNTQTMSQVLTDSVGETQLALWLLGVFALTALVLAAVGIYGVMAYAVRQRTREIGTRIALGATKRDIVWLVMRQGAIIGGTGTVIGVIAGLIAARSLVTLVYDVSTADPATLVIAAVVLFATTMMACYLPARRAASVDPVRTLAEH